MCLITKTSSNLCFHRRSGWWGSASIWRAVSHCPIASDPTPKD